MALALTATKIQVPAQSNPLPDPAAEKTETEAASLFADVLSLLSHEPEETLPDSGDTQEEASGLAEPQEVLVAEPGSPFQGLMPAMLSGGFYAPASQMRLAAASTPVDAEKVGMETASASASAMEAVAVTEAGNAAESPVLESASFLPRRFEGVVVPGAAVLPAPSRSPESEAGADHALQPSPSRFAAAATIAEHAITTVTRKQGAAAAAAPDIPTSLAQVQVAPSGGAALEVMQHTTLKLPAGAPQQWREPLLDSLGERLQMQIGARSENAVIRLDPPMMGQIEIRIHHEAGSLQIQMSASNGEVLRQLNDMREHLRQDLVHRQYTDVSVQVSGTSPDGRQRQRQAEAEQNMPGRALADHDEEPFRFALLSEKD